MALDTFHMYKKLYEQFFGVTFKHVPEHNIVAQYELVEGTVRIERNSSYWYHYAPEKLSEWELFCLIEAASTQPKSTTQVSQALHALSQRKGIALNGAKRDLLIHLYDQVHGGYSIIERILKDPHVSGIRITCLNRLCSLTILMPQYGECRTNIAPLLPLVNRIESHLIRHGCKDDGSCTARIADLDATATLRISKTSALRTVRIELSKN